MQTQNCFVRTKLLTDDQKVAFVETLNAKLNLREGESGGMAWDCRHDLQHCTHILDQMGLSVGEVKKLLSFFKRNGGYCDCEVMMNVVNGDA